MKNYFVLFTVLTSIACAFAQAETVCGPLSSGTEGDRDGAIALEVVYQISPDAKEPVRLVATSSDMNEQFEELDGKEVCASGRVNRQGDLVVTSIERTAAQPHN